MSTANTRLPRSRLSDVKVAAVLKHLEISHVVLRVQESCARLSCTQTPGYQSTWISHVVLRCSRPTVSRAGDTVLAQGDKVGRTQQERPIPL